MNPIRFWFGLFAIFGWVLVLPGWMYWSGPGLTNQSTEVEWLVAILLPLAVLVTLASWVQTWE